MLSRDTYTYTNVSDLLREMTWFFFEQYFTLKNSEGPLDIIYIKHSQALLGNCMCLHN